MINLQRRILYISNAVVWVLSVSLLLGGGAAKNLPPYPTYAASSYPYFQVHDGLAIGIKPLTDPQESEKYFGTDLSSRGVLAIFVSAENQMAPGTFVLSKERFTLQTTQGEEHPVSGHEQIESTTLKAVHKTTQVLGENLAVATVYLLCIPALPFIVGSIKIQEHEEAIMRKFLAEELQFDPISSGQETHGFVYFPRPPSYPGPGQ